MNTIFFDRSGIAAFSDQLSAETHRHGLMQLFVAQKGFLSLEAEGISHTGRALLVAPGTLHRFTPESGLHFTMLIRPLTGLFQALQARFLLQRPVHIFHESTLQEFQQAAPMTAPVTEEAYAAYVSRLFDSIGLGTRPDPILEERIQQLKTLLDGDRLPELSVPAAAHAVSLSASRLSHLFKEETGMPLKSYLSLFMLERAYLSFFRHKNSTTAAMQAGFDSPSHFAAASKRLTGMSARGFGKDSVFLKVSHV